MSEREHNLEGNKDEFFQGGVHHVSASKIADQFWCEMQLHLKLQLGIEPTPEMIKGTEIHRSLEEELGPVIEVEVTTNDWEKVNNTFGRLIMPKKIFELAKDLDMKYTCILLVDVLEHIEKDLNLLKKLHDLLVPGGYLLIHVPNKQRSHIFCSTKDKRSGPQN